MSDRRVLVTGGSGFLGRHVLARLAPGRAVVALARREEAEEIVRRRGAVAVRGDLDDPSSVSKAFASAEADTLVNLASLGSGHAGVVVDAARTAGITRAVFISTTAIFTTLDSRSRGVRLAGERSIGSSDLEWTILRPTMIYGDEGDRNMIRLLRVLRRTPVLPVPGRGDRLQQPVHVEDLADAVVASIDRPGAVGNAYDVAGPEPLTFRSVIAQAGAAVGRTPRIVPVPLRATVALVRSYERFSRRPRLTAEQLERLAEDKEFDIGPARRDLGFAPRSFAHGIAAEARLLL